MTKPMTQAHNDGMGGTDKTSMKLKIQPQHFVESSASVFGMVMSKILSGGRYFHNDKESYFELWPSPFCGPRIANLTI